MKNVIIISIIIIIIITIIIIIIITIMRLIDTDLYNVASSIYESCRQKICS